ncbi:MAG: type II secretion system F family protein [Candidatus Brocadiaceae bacterium]|jgi:tight adherence protein C
MDIANIILLVGVFGAVVGVFVFLALLMEKRSGAGKATDRLQRAPRKGKAAADRQEKKRALKQSLDAGDPLPVRLVRRFSRAWRLGDASHSRLQEMLVHAGIREKGAVEIFLGAKMALALALPSAVVAFLMWRAGAAGVRANLRHIFMYGAVAAIMGLMVPNIWLRRKAEKRIQQIRLSLPDALDLLIVCVEAGLGLDAALVRISKELSDVAPDLCDELVLLNLEIGAGKPRDECLRHLALRTGCEEVESLTARINQAARFGTNLGDSLRIHSDTLRRKRRQQAEERAAKTAVKLLFPLIFFVFPAVFVVILGPAVPRLMSELF